MVSRAKLDDAALAAQRRSLPEWELVAERPALRRVFQFANFSAAWAFMARVALLAERAQHHPEWSNVYGRVDVTLTTHDAGGITALDIDFARSLDALAAECNASRPEAP